MIMKCQSFLKYSNKLIININKKILINIIIKSIYNSLIVIKIQSKIIILPLLPNNLMSKEILFNKIV